MRAIIAQGVLEKRTALLIQNFLEQVRTAVPYVLALSESLP
jgi:hypothetical protein